MSATATISWQNQASGTTQELYYGKDLLATGLPGSGSGWLPSDQNPLPSAAGSATISNLDDNVKYKFLVKSDCTNSQNIYSSSTAVKWICGALQTSGPQSGTLVYTLQVDPSVSNAGSGITSIEVQLIGVDRVNFGNLYQVRTYSAPYSGSYTDQFNGVNGDVDWTIRVIYKTGAYPSTEIHECSSQAYSTTSIPGVSYLQVRNALVDGVLTQLSLNNAPQLAQTLTPGYASKTDVTALLSGGTPLQPTVNLTGVVSGTQLYARQIRNNAQLTGGLFTYAGSNSPISSVPWNIQNGDIIEITPAFTNAYVFKQTIVAKNTDGYDLNVKIDVPLGAPSTYNISFTGYDYSSGESEHLTGTVTIAQGDTEGTLVHIQSTLPTPEYTRATVTSVCFTTDAGIAYPHIYDCLS